MKAIFKVLMRSYKLGLSPVLSGLGCGCRFYPNCSDYASEAMAMHPFGRAIALIAARLIRCAPWHPGGVNPVPRTADPERRR